MRGSSSASGSSISCGSKKYTEFNRFDGDYMNEPFLDLSVEGLHPGPTHNKSYVDKLINHIQTNLPNYLIK